MEIEVTGLPEPTVVWMKDDKPLQEAGVSQHRLISQGNSYKLIIEKGVPNDSGKYMVKATNAGGEAKSIADCAILEPSPERQQVGSKNVSFDTQDNLETDTFIKEPMSFQTTQSDISTESDLHSLSESKIVTEHRCTTEATMRLEHKPANLDLPVLSERPKGPIEATNIGTSTDLPDEQILKSVSTNTDATRSKIGTTQTPPEVPPKPQPASNNTTQPPTPIQQPEQPQFINTHSTGTGGVTSTMSSSSMRETSKYESTTSEKKTSSFEYFKQIDSQGAQQPTIPGDRYERRQIYPTDKQPTPMTFSNPSERARTASLTHTEDIKNLVLVPGSPPEMCYEPKSDTVDAKPQIVNECIKILEASQQTQSTKDPPVGGVRMLPYKVAKAPTLAPELSAPFLVKEVNKAITIPASPNREKTPIDDIHLEPGTPPEICFAPKQEVRRQSLVEQMEKTLEQTIQQNATKQPPPMSVPTLTPPLASNALKTNHAYKPPPPVVPQKLNVGYPYESDYESDRWKYSGSESDEISFRPVAKSGYAADTEEISNYQKMQSMQQDGRTFYESSSKTMHQVSHGPQGTGNTVPKPYHQQQQQQQQRSIPKPMPTPSPVASQQPFYQQPQLQKQPPAQLYFTSKQEGGHEKHEYSNNNEYRREEKDYKCMSSMSSSYYSSSNINKVSNFGAPKYQTTPVKTTTPTPYTPTITPIPAQGKTPAEFSDYSSEVEERFRSVSRNQDADNDVKGYRVVFPPTPTPKSNLVNGHKSPAVVVTPSPMEFEPTQPAVSTYPRQKFEPIKKEIRHEIRTESRENKQNFQQQKMQKTYQQQQTVYKPKPVAAKFLAAAQQQQYQQPTQPRYEPRAQPGLYYNAIAGTPLHNAKIATETKNVMQMKESSETCNRVVNMQQTKRVIHFDNQKEQRERQLNTPLEPFPYSPSPSRYTPTYQTRVPPPATPTKFVPGDFRESDYDHEVDNAKIRPLWTPYGENGSLRYRHVEPPHGGGRSCSVPRSYERVLSPMEFDHGPEMPRKIQVDARELRSPRGGSFGASTINSNQRTQSLNRHTSMQNSSSSNTYQQHYQTLQRDNTIAEKRFPRDDMNLKVGSPPKYGYIQSQLDQQGKQLGSTFMQKSHQFVSDITSDLQQKASKTTKFFNGVTEPKVVTPSFRPGFKRAPSEGDNKPEAYRDESRVSQYDQGTQTDALLITEETNENENSKQGRGDIEIDEGDAKVNVETSPSPPREIIHKIRRSASFSSSSPNSLGAYSPLGSAISTTSLHYSPIRPATRTTLMTDTLSKYQNVETTIESIRYISRKTLNVSDYGSDTDKSRSESTLTHSQSTRSRSTTPAAAPVPAVRNTTISTTTTGSSNNTRSTATDSRSNSTSSSGIDSGSGLGTIYKATTIYTSSSNSIMNGGEISDFQTPKLLINLSNGSSLSFKQTAV